MGFVLSKVRNMVRIYYYFLVFLGIFIFFFRFEYLKSCIIKWLEIFKIYWFEMIYEN